MHIDKTDGGIWELEKCPKTTVVFDLSKGRQWSAYDVEMEEGKGQRNKCCHSPLLL